MKILTSKQIREADQYTIKNEPISSLDLMERASEAFVTKFLGLHPQKASTYIFCGTGNNGGDGLAIARMLLKREWKVKVFVIGDTEKGSSDFKTNLDRLGRYEIISSRKDFPTIDSSSIIIDGLLGSGLSRPVEGLYSDLIQYLNNQDAQRVAIDISSGLYADQPLPKHAVAFQADYTISFQVPKLAFFLPECSRYVGEWRVVDIGLDKEFINRQESTYSITEKEEVFTFLPKRTRFAHKNSVGRLMIVAGSRGKMGAAVLCTRAAFRAGVGLVNVCAPNCGIDIMQIAIPEAMVLDGKGANEIQSIPTTDDTVIVGPGLGTHPKTLDAFENFLRFTKQPLVIDADGLNLLAEKKSLLKQVPADSILTPHPGEFKRMVGECQNDFEKLNKLSVFCQKYNLNVVLKGAFSAVCNTKGEIHFNSNGNPGLATAGSGDVLTGVIGALLAQGLSPFNALKLGVYLHGAAGDEAVRNKQVRWIQASDIINFIPVAASSLALD
jgi:NAD(P)H-hydrate epimerase